MSERCPTPPLAPGPHIKVAAVASRWQRVGDLIGTGFEPRTKNLHEKQTSYHLCSLAGDSVFCNVIIATHVSLTCFKLRTYI